MQPNEPGRRGPPRRARRARVGLQPWTLSPGAEGSRATLCDRSGALRGGRLTRWGCSSAGRAPRSHRGGQGFESPHLHHPSLRRRDAMQRLVERCRGSRPVAAPSRRPRRECTGEHRNGSGRATPLSSRDLDRLSLETRPKGTRRVRETITDDGRGPDPQIETDVSRSPSVTGTPCPMAPAVRLRSGSGPAADAGTAFSRAARVASIRRAPAGNRRSS